jgi:periplasmic divalent cation tolerance protein
VNILPGIRSCYMWEGKLTWSEELLLVMKTTAARFEDLKKRVLELHSYQIPEIIGVSIDEGLEPYLEWIRSNVRQG